MQSLTAQLFRIVQAGLLHSHVQDLAGDHSRLHGLKSPADGRPLRQVGSRLEGYFCAQRCQQVAKEDAQAGAAGIGPGGVLAVRIVSDNWPAQGQMGGRAAPTTRRAVDDVVVDQGAGLVDLQGAGKVHYRLFTIRILPAIQSPPDIAEQQGAQSLAASASLDCLEDDRLQGLLGGVLIQGMVQSRLWSSQVVAMLLEQFLHALFDPCCCHALHALEPIRISAQQAGSRTLVDG